MYTFSLIIPTRNAGKDWNNWFCFLQKQSLFPQKIVMIDSSSEDDTVFLAKKHGVIPTLISKEQFNHGGTRNLGVLLSGKTDIIVFMTQDALLENESSLSSLLDCFGDPDVAAVCGRQLPHLDANPIAIHARKFNYPDVTQVKSSSDISSMGLKVAFMSNSFAAYRRDVFEKLGGFPENTILAEDMYLSAKMILAGYKVAYCAEAIVRHSHNYTPWEEFHRYFDTGVFHACEPWIQEKLGGASGEGLRFIKSEMNFLWHDYPWWIPRAIITDFCKILGYKFGLYYKKIPAWLRPKFSMYKSYWLQQHTLK